jgi:hypothetical protein
VRLEIGLYIKALKMLNCDVEVVEAKIAKIYLHGEDIIMAIIEL